MSIRREKLLFHLAEQNCNKLPNFQVDFPKILIHTDLFLKIMNITEKN